jgi:PAS domain-containing protein
MKNLRNSLLEGDTQHRWLVGAIITLAAITTLELTSFNPMDLAHPLIIYLLIVIYSMVMVGVLGGLVSLSIILIYMTVHLLIPTAPSSDTLYNAIHLATVLIASLFLAYIVRITENSTVRLAKQLKQSNASLQTQINECDALTDHLVHARAEAEKVQGRLRAILDALPVGVFIANASGAIVTANQFMYKILGEDVPLASSIEEHGKYKGWWANTGQRIEAHEWALVRAVTKGESSIGEVINIERFDGTQATILNSASPIVDSQGKVTGGVAAVLDITQQRQTEDALRQSETLY